MLIEITYNVTDVFMSTTDTPVYVEISFEQPGSASAVWGSITGTLSNQTDLQNALDAKLDESTIDGGTEGQILSKASGTDFDFAWINNYAKYLATNVRNQTGSTIDAFQVVYISGATGNKPLVSLADADTEATSTKTYGVTATSIANNGTGDVVTAGELSGIDTSAFNEGDLLWLSTTAGGVVTSPPAEPAHAVFIGYVVRSHPTLGTIDVSIQNGYELNELHGVQITTPTDNQGLFYNATSTLWENKSITTALGYTPVPTTRNITINGVTYDLSADRTYTISTGISGSGASGQVTYWDGTSSVSGSNNLFWDNTNGRLGIGTNVPAYTLDIAGTFRSTGISYNTGYNFSVQRLSFNNGTVGGNFGYIMGSSNGVFRLLNAAESDFTRLQFGGTTTAFPAIQRVGVSIAVVDATGTGLSNLIVGGTTDSAHKLQVYGDTLLRGSGNTSATTALTVQNSSSQNVLRARNDSALIFGVGDARMSPTTNGNININGNNLAFTSGELSGTNYQFYFNNIYVNLTTTSGISGGVNIVNGFAPTSGTGVFNTLAINNTINQTGGANGITRGLYVNPTLTAAADFRAIETTAGNVLFGSNFFWDNANGRLGIGTTTLERRLNVAGDVVISGPSGGIYFKDNTNNPYIWVQDSRSIRFGTDNGERMRLDNFGNLGIATNAPTARLDVRGDTLLRGSGNTSATTALTVQNSSSVNLLSIKNDGDIVLGIRTGGIRPSLTIGPSFQGSLNFTTVVFANWNTTAYAVFTGIDPASSTFIFGGTTINSSAKLQIDSNTSGFLPPRMTTTQKNAISTPAAGLVVYDTTLNKLCVYTTAWETITSI